MPIYLLIIWIRNKFVWRQIRALCQLHHDHCPIAELPTNKLKFKIDLSFRQLVVREEESLELDPVQDVQNFGGLGQRARLQRLHALQKSLETSTHRFIPVYEL